MKVNVFEGSRRIVRLIIVLWVIAVATYFYNDDSSSRLVYLTSAPDKPFLIVTDCPYDARERVVYRDVSGYGMAHITLCFLTDKLNKGSSDDIAYGTWTDEKGQQWYTVDGKYSDAVNAYTSSRALSFELGSTLSPPARDMLNARWNAHLTNWFWTTIGGLVALFVIQYVTGWIVRGVAGIPMGHDSRP